MKQSRSSIEGAFFVCRVTIATKLEGHWRGLTMRAALASRLALRLLLPINELASFCQSTIKDCVIVHPRLLRRLVVLRSQGRQRQIGVGSMAAFCHLWTWTWGRPLVLYGAVDF